MYSQALEQYVYCTRRTTICEDCHMYGVSPQRRPKCSSTQEPCICTNLREPAYVIDYDSLSVPQVDRLYKASISDAWNGWRHYDINAAYAEFFRSQTPATPIDVSNALVVDAKGELNGPGRQAQGMPPADLNGPQRKKLIREGYDGIRNLAICSKPECTFNRHGPRDETNAEEQTQCCQNCQWQGLPGHSHYCLKRPHMSYTAVREIIAITMVHPEFKREADERLAELRDIATTASEPISRSSPAVTPAKAIPKEDPSVTVYGKS